MCRIGRVEGDGARAKRLVLPPRIAGLHRRSSLPNRHASRAAEALESRRVAACGAAWLGQTSKIGIEKTEKRHVSTHILYTKGRTLRR